MIVNYANLIKKVKGISVPKPLSGTLSGHAAGEPFDKHVYKEIKKSFPDNTFRQYEYLNDLYSKNPDTIGFDARQELFNSPTVLFLLSRGKNATDKWSIENPFEEKQNDTADIIVVKDNFYELIDIKTRSNANTVSCLRFRPIFQRFTRAMGKRIPETLRYTSQKESRRYDC